jgi:hypothetical protein
MVHARANLTPEVKFEIGSIKFDLKNLNERQLNYRHWQTLMRHELFLLQYG